jgi:hypothetical protein
VEASASRARGPARCRFQILQNERLFLFAECPNVRHEQLDLAGVERGLERRHIVFAVLDLSGDLRVGQLLHGGRTQVRRIQRFSGCGSVPVVAVADRAIGLEDGFAGVRRARRRSKSSYRQKPLRCPRERRVEATIWRLCWTSCSRCTLPCSRYSLLVDNDFSTADRSTTPRG